MVYITAGVSEFLPSQLSWTFKIVQQTFLVIIANMVTDVPSIALPTPRKRTSSNLEFISPVGDDVTFELDELVRTTWTPEIEGDDWGVLSLYHSGVDKLSQFMISRQCELPFPSNGTMTELLKCSNLTWSHRESDGKLMRLVHLFRPDGRR